MITAVIEHSMVAGEVRMDAPSLAVMNELRDFMFQRIYLGPVQRHHLGAGHRGHPAADGLPPRASGGAAQLYRDTEADLVTQVADYVAGMTDRFAIATHQNLFGTPGMSDPIL